MTDNITTKNNEQLKTTCYNVYFTRGHGVLKKPGNIKYRELICEHAAAYKNKIHSKGKNSVAQRVISTIQALGGKFYHLKENQSNILQWETLCPKLLLKKVKQSLRDVKTSTPTPNATGKKSPPTAPISFVSWTPTFCDDKVSTEAVRNNVHNDFKASLTSSPDAFNSDHLLSGKTKPNNLANSTSTASVLNPFGKTHEYKTVNNTEHFYPTTSTLTSTAVISTTSTSGAFNALGNAFQSVNNTAHYNSTDATALASSLFNADDSLSNANPTTNNIVQNNTQPSTATLSPHNAVIFLDDPTTISKSNDNQDLNPNLRSSSSTIDFIENLFLDGASTSVNQNNELNESKHSTFSATSFDSNIFETTCNGHSECNNCESIGESTESNKEKTE